MDWMRILWSRFAALLRKRRLDADLDEELRAHVDLAIEENLKRGLAPDDARNAALREFGGVTQAKESYRMQRGVPFLEQIGRDIRFGLRQLRKSPGFALTAIFTLALGLGANTAVFSLVNGLLLRPLPVPHAENLAVIHYTRSDDPDPNYSFSSPMFRALEQRHDVFSDVAAFANRSMQVRGASGNVVIYGVMVSGQFFNGMEVKPLRGRALTPQDDIKGGSPTGFAAVIGEGFWQSWFNRAPDVIGRRLTIANAPFTVVGVMPKGFIGADPVQRPQIYVPIWAEPIIDAPYDSIAGGRHSWWMRVIARRAPGVGLEQANSALGAISNPILEETAPGDKTWIDDARKHHFQLLAQPGSQGFSYLQLSFFKPLAAVFCLCAAMLLLACLNLASLLMARSAARERELATRLAMGATRRRLVQQLMIESLLIALLGTLAGIIAAPVVSHSLAALLLGSSSIASIDTSLDLRVLFFVALTAIVAAVVIGLIPALRATSKNLNEQIKSGAHTVAASEKRRVLPRLLMGLEVALALILVVGAGLLAMSVWRLYGAGLGFEPRGLANVELNMGKQGLSGDALIRWYEQYLDALRHAPGVKDVSLAQQTPMDGSVWDGGYKTPLSGGERKIFMNRISPGFLRTMRIPLVAGRDFKWNDTLASGYKIILSEKAAKTLFPGINPIGRRVTDEYQNSSEVIGIAGDIRYRSIREDPLPEGYSPITQNDDSKPSYTALVRFDGGAEALAAAARSLAAKMAPEIPAPVMTTMSAQLDDSITSERMMAMLAVFFAACALLVTAIGLYGTLAYATARRTSEIGIRMALGARRGQVVALVFRENAWIAAGGSLLGLAIALLSARALASFLYGISANDPRVLVESVAILALIASAASIVPAIRAARVEPMTALRME
ncbi:MAG: ABC transporter permease [Terracidiphilus sp.]